MVIDVVVLYVNGFFGLKLVGFSVLLFVGRFIWIFILDVCCGLFDELGICMGIVVFNVIDVFVLLELIGKFIRLLFVLFIIKLFEFSLNWLVCVNEKLWEVILGMVVKKLLLVIVKFSVVLVNCKLFWVNCCVIFCVSILLFILVLLLVNKEVVYILLNFVCDFLKFIVLMFVMLLVVVFKFFCVVDMLFNVILKDMSFFFY